MKITLGIAYGLLYLHEDSSLRVMHWDFKSNNTMLEDDFTTKVLILGLVRITLDERNFWHSVVEPACVATFGMQSHLLYHGPHSYMAMHGHP